MIPRICNRGELAAILNRIYICVYLTLVCVIYLLPKTAIRSFQSFIPNAVNMSLSRNTRICCSICTSNTAAQQKTKHRLVAREIRSAALHRAHRLTHRFCDGRTQTIAMVAGTEQRNLTVSTEYKPIV